MKDIEGSVRNSYNICTPNNFEIKYNVKKCLLKILKLWNSWQLNSVFFYVQYRNLKSCEYYAIAL